MKILHFILGRCNPDSANGVDKTVFYLSKAQAQLGNDVAVFSLTTKTPIPIPGVVVNTFPVKRFPFSLSKSLIDQLKKLKPDIVHLHSSYIPQNFKLACFLKRQKIPYVVTPHGGLSSYVLAKKWYLKIPYKYFFELRLLNNASFIHCLNGTEEAKKYGVKVPIIIAPNGMDIFLENSDYDEQFLVEKHPELKGKKIFLFLGRLALHHKGLDLLVNGFSLFKSRDKYLLKIAGPDSEGKRKKLERMCDKLKIFPNVIFLGPVYGKEKNKLLKSIDVFVHTSRYEGISFAILEAAAFKKPLLLTPAADPCGMVKRYRAGVIVSPNSKCIADGFKKIAQLDKLELKRMGNRAGEMIKNEFSWENTALLLLDAYKKYGTSAKQN